MNLTVTNNSKKKFLGKMSFRFFSISLLFLVLTFSCSAESASAEVDRSSSENVSELASSDNTVASTSTPHYALPEDALSVVEALQTTFRSVTEHVLPSVVEIDVEQTQKVTMPSMTDPFEFFFRFPDSKNQKKGEEREYKTQSMGSGFIVKKVGSVYYVLTNHHVVDGASDVTVKLYDEREFKGKVVGSDQRKDIALVSFTSKDSIPVIPMGDSSTVRPGDIVFAVGNPLGFFSSVTQGIVSAVGRNGGPAENINDFIQTDASINQGNSGGPLVNIYGEVIGINTWIASNSGANVGLGFSIPVNNIKKAIDDFIGNGKIKYGWLGVSLMEIDNDYKESLKIGDKKGALVTQLFLGSPADKAGFQPGDYIISLNGQKVKSVSQLVRDIGDLTAGATPKFIIIRSEKELEINVKITERNETEVTDNSKLWLGFTPFPLTEDYRKQLKLADDVKGVIVASLQEKTAAAVLGLKTGDVIVAVNDNRVSNVYDFYKEIAKTGTSDIWFTVNREGHEVSTLRHKRGK